MPRVSDGYPKLLVTLSNLELLFECSQPISDTRRFACENHTHIDTDTAQCNRHAKAVLIGHIVADKNLLAGMKRLLGHKRIDGVSLVERAMTDLKSHARRQDFEFGPGFGGDRTREIPHLCVTERRLTIMHDDVVFFR